MSETIIKNACVYCGEAPVNHRMYRIENFFSSIFDSHMVSIASRAPLWLKNFVGMIPVALFKFLMILRVARLSDDIERANSFRSRVMWEEANTRGIDMKQVVLGTKHLDWYRAVVGGKEIYFESLPIKPEHLDFRKDWDNKIILKKELQKYSIPVPAYVRISPFNFQSPQKIFSAFDMPFILKPELGSRGRHTVTNIQTFSEFQKGLAVTRQISLHIVAEEHLEGSICRATLVDGKLAGFYMGQVPRVTGEGKQTIRELIAEKNRTQIDRYHIRIDEELHDHIARGGFSIDDILPDGMSLTLSHRRGQLFGGMTREMIDELHPSFIPILERAAAVTGLSIVGFDCIIPDPTKDEASQRWGIIECNTLPFIDMHYYALEGKPRNIAGMIWDLWN